MKFHITATERHLPYGITPVTSEHTPPELQTGWYSIYIPGVDERLSWPRWLLT